MDASRRPEIAAVVDRGVRLATAALPLTRAKFDQGHLYSACRAWLASYRSKWPAFQLIGHEIAWNGQRVQRRAVVAMVAAIRLVRDAA